MRRQPYLVIIMIFSLLIAGCSSSIEQEDMVKRMNVEKDDAKELAIQVVVGYGEVDISSDATGWVDGKAHYNFSDLEPTLTYKLTSGKGKISIEQPNKRLKKINQGQVKNEWELFITDELPVSLNVETGASDTNLDLREMRLNNLHIDSGVGRTFVNLNGLWQESFDVHVEMGVGESTIIFPEDVGVKIKAEQGIGATNYEGLTKQGEKHIYVNEAFETADIIINVQAEIGVGEANFIIKDN